MTTFLTKLAETVAAAAPRISHASRPSLSSLVAAVQSAAPAPAAARRPMPPEAPIVLVSCSDTKIETQGRPVAAADLYASPLFRKSLAHARAITSEDRIRILSARHGLLRTTDKITTYDFPIQKMSERERDAWGERVHGELGRQFGWQPRDLILLAGAEYVKALRGLTNRFRNDRLPWTIDLPFGAKKGERMAIGERLRWLNDQAYERGEAPAGAPRTTTKSLASIAAVVAAASPAPASSTRLAQAVVPAARPLTGAATRPRAAAKSLASLTNAVVIATPSASAPASTRAGAPSVRAGTRISFLGDTANPPSDGTVTKWVVDSDLTAPRGARTAAPRRRPCEGPRAA